MLIQKIGQIIIKGDDDRFRYPEGVHNCILDLFFQNKEFVCCENNEEKESKDWVYDLFMSVENQKEVDKLKV